MRNFSQTNGDFPKNRRYDFNFVLKLSLFHTIFIIRKLYKICELCVLSISKFYVNSIKFGAVVFGKIDF